MPELIFFVVSLLIAYATRPKPPKTSPLTLEDFEVPTAEEDRSIPVVFGTVTITGPNVVWHGDFGVDTQTEDGVKTRSYRLGMHFGICYGPVDSLLKIMVDEKDLWTTPVTESSSIQLSAPGLFGGDKGEGGIEGQFDVMMGEEGQAPNPYLTQVQGSLQPAYYGVLTGVYRKGLVSTNTPYIKPWSFKVKRIVEGWSDWPEELPPDTIDWGSFGAPPP